MIKVAVVGATGYAGAEVARLTEGHPMVSQVTRMSARDGERVPADPRATRFIEPLDQGALGDGFDVVFVCLPHGFGHGITATALGGEAARVVDLSADHRFRDAAAYSNVYGIEHPSPGACAEAVYGLTEHARDELPGARLVANPGCYPTATLLGLQPLVEAALVRPGSRVTVDAKSGVSGAGKSPSPTTLYGNVNENCRAYGVGTHRHGTEIKSRIGDSVSLTFVPHLLPMFRGMLATVFLEPAPGVTVDHAREALESCYGNAPFVHPVDSQPETAHVARTNHAHLTVVEADGALVVTCAIDNLMKGAASAAVQNMNVMLGFDEEDGLGAPDGTLL